MNLKFLTGDIHGEKDINRLSSKKWKEKKILTQDDYLFILGDFGLPLTNWKDKTDKYYLGWLSKFDLTIFVIPGNHENYNLLYSLPLSEAFGGKVRFIRKNIILLETGEIYDIGGDSFLVLGGAESTDKMYRTPGVSWWPEEVPNYSQIQNVYTNLEKRNFNVDYVLSHTIPRSSYYNLGFSSYDFERYPDTLELIREKISYKHWYAGHFHIEKEDTENRLSILYTSIIPLPQ